MNAKYYNLILIYRKNAIANVSVGAFEDFLKIAAYFERSHVPLSGSNHRIEFYVNYVCGSKQIIGTVGHAGTTNLQQLVDAILKGEM